MIADTLLLLRLRWQMTWNGWRHRTLGRKLLLLVGFAWLIVTVGGVSSAVGWGGAAIVQRFFDTGLEPLVPGLILTAATVLLIISAFGIALGTLFFSNDLELLMVAPINRRAVFMAKLLDGTLWYYGILAISALPALALYGWQLDYSVWYYPLMVLALAGAPLLTTGIGALAVMLVARFAPARRVREVLGFVAAIFGISCSLLGQTSRLWVDRFQQFETDPQQLVQAVERITRLPLPTLTAGRGLAAAGHGSVGSGLLFLVGYLALTFGFFALCVVAADRLYSSGWTRMQSAGSARRERKRNQRGGALATAPGPLTVPLKDWRVIPRDLRNFAQMLSPLLILPIVYINIISGGGSRGSNQQQINRLFGRLFGGEMGTLTLSEVLLAGSVLFVTALVFMRVALTGISMEGRSWWILKVAPLSRWELLRGKFLAAYIPFAILQVVLLAGVAFWRHFSVVAFIYTLFGTLVLGAAILASAVGLGVPWARLDWDDPRRMSSGWGGLFAFILETGVIFLGMTFLALPALAGMWQPGLLGVAWFAGIVGALVLSAVVAGVFMSFGVSRLARVGEA